MEKKGVALALQHWGNSPTRMASAITAMGKKLTRQNVENLSRRGANLPAKFCPEVAESAGVKLSDLNPEVNWELAKKRSVKA